jgi:hypothetical protein
MNQQNNTPKPVKPIQELLTKEVDRGEFLSIVGVGALTIVGLGPIVHFLTGKGHKQTIIHKTQTSGFGSGPYGA